MRIPKPNTYGLLLSEIFKKLGGKAVLTTVAVFSFHICVFSQEQVSVDRQVTLMGSIFNFTIVDADSISANKNIDKAIAEIDRIENLISEWRPETQISQVNQNAGIKAVKVDKEVFDLTKRAIAYSKMSDGAFDISAISMDKIWKFDGSMTEMPSKEAIAQSVRNVNYKNIVLDSVNSTIYLSKKGMKIGFGSIGKGYAADKGRELMQKIGVKSGMVDASGDIATWGKPLNAKTWNIGIRNPFKHRKITKVIQLKNAAVATSGSYEKFAEIDGLRYSHIINPKTGMPATGLSSVTIYGPSCEFANALSTSIMVLGKKKGKKLVKKFPNYRYYMIEDR